MHTGVSNHEGQAIQEGVLSVEPLGGDCQYGDRIAAIRYTSWALGSARGAL